MNVADDGTPATHTTTFREVTMPLNGTAPTPSRVPRRRSTTRQPAPAASEAATQPVAIYARVSTEDQAERATIQAQLDFLRRYVDLHSLPVAGDYVDDGISGTVPFSDRPKGQRLLRDAAAGRFDTVLVYRVDRLGRSLRSLLTPMTPSPPPASPFAPARSPSTRRRPLARSSSACSARWRNWRRRRLPSARVAVASGSRVPAGIRAARSRLATT